MNPYVSILQFQKYRHNYKHIKIVKSNQNHSTIRRRRREDKNIKHWSKIKSGLNTNQKTILVKLWLVNSTWWIRIIRDTLVPAVAHFHVERRHATVPASTPTTVIITTWMATAITAIRTHIPIRTTTATSRGTGTAVSTITNGTIITAAMVAAITKMVITAIHMGM